MGVVAFTTVMFGFSLISTISGQNHSLDVDTDSNRWDISTTNYEDWFSYFHYMNDTSPYVEEYFRNSSADLSPFSDVEGVWVAFNSSLQPPTPGKPYPTITPPVSHLIWVLEVYYYVFHNATIVLTPGDETLPKWDKDKPQEWKYFSIQIASQVTLELKTTSKEDFVLIDKIILNPARTPTTTTTEKGEPSSLATVRHTMTPTIMATSPTSTLVPTSTRKEEGSGDSGGKFENMNISLSMASFIFLLYMYSV